MSQSAPDCRLQELIVELAELSLEQTNRRVLSIEWEFREDEPAYVCELATPTGNVQLIAMPLRLQELFVGDLRLYVPGRIG